MSQHHFRPPPNTQDKQSNRPRTLHDTTPKQSGAEQGVTPELTAPAAERLTGPTGTHNAFSGFPLPCRSAVPVSHRADWYKLLLLLLFCFVFFVCGLLPCRSVVP